MKTEKVKVSYRDKTTGQNVGLGEADSCRFDNVQEAVDYFDTEQEGKGEELVLSYVHSALDIERQNQFRAANRPDREKTQSASAKFKQLSPEKQAELLRQAGIEV